MSRVVLYCIALCYTTLHSTAPHKVLLSFAVLYLILTSFAVLHCTVLLYILLCCMVLFCTDELCYIVKYFSALYCAALNAGEFRCA